jgi:hypothetical protein
MSQLSTGDWNKPVLSPMHNQSWHLNLRKSIQVIRSKAPPSVFASLQLPKRSACTRLPGKPNDFVESLLNRGQPVGRDFLQSDMNFDSSCVITCLKSISCGTFGF